MNLNKPQFVFTKHVIQFWRQIRRFFAKTNCQAFGVRDEKMHPTIEKIYVINLDRASIRWSAVEDELKNNFDRTACPFINLTERYAAVDAKNYLHEPEKNADIDPSYSLADQLFVEPQPSVTPTQFELDKPIRMSRAEVAVAQSHINIWRKIVACDHDYALVLEDDILFDIDFSARMNQAWLEIMEESEKSGKFDILYLSYFEVKHGAPKTFVSASVFQPLRGLWCLSGYVLSKKGAEKLLRQLPCRGPIDLWINQQFGSLDVRATKKSIINQRGDTESTNSYSILPSLTMIGAINCEGASLFNQPQLSEPVFAFGDEEAGHSSLAMALSMLGYRCCSDLDRLPTYEHEQLLTGGKFRVFNAYVNIGSIATRIDALRNRYPTAKFFHLVSRNHSERNEYYPHGVEYVVLHKDEQNKWKIICEYLRCAPPTCSFPALPELGQRRLTSDSTNSARSKETSIPLRDRSPWVVDQHISWNGINVESCSINTNYKVLPVTIIDPLERFDSSNWHLRSDTFTDNLAMFRPSNIEYRDGIGATLIIRMEDIGARKYSAASMTSKGEFLYGKFEASIKASNSPGVVTGFFLHRNSPRQEIDIEIAGNRSDQLLVNVFYNPGDDGSNFDYGYRGTPTIIDLGFDASQDFHQYTIEWSHSEIRWLVDDILVHKRALWEPTPIPHLPLTLHINSWLTRSKQLAGKINNRRLPSTSIVKAVFVEANSVIKKIDTRRYENNRNEEQVK